jgi:hypothetical protein
LDIDHSPYNLLDPRHALLYEPVGLQRMTRFLHPGGVFAMWSNDPPDETFMATLSNTFMDVKAHVVSVAESDKSEQATNTVYVGRRVPGNYRPAITDTQDHPSS